MPALQTKKRNSSRALVPSAEDVALVSVPGDEEPQYIQANLRPGTVLLIEFSRNGHAKSEDDDNTAEPEDAETKKAKKRTQKLLMLPKMATKVVNMAYAKMVENFTHLPWGAFFCETSEVSKARALLDECQEGALFVNRLAAEHGNPGRVRIDVFPIQWDHNSPAIQLRMAEMIATKLISLREIYTSREMWEYRVRLDRCRNLEKVVRGEEHDIVKEALHSTESQRKLMVTIYGDRKGPVEWVDPQTGRLKDSIRLDFTAIDKAIKHFMPSWVPPTSNS